jgi:hypothetical protein
MIKRFAPAYLVAALAANATFLAYAAIFGAGFETAEDFLGALIVYQLYSLVFTLALGLPTWFLLTRIGSTSRAGYILGGVIAGGLAGVVDIAHRTIDFRSGWAAPFALAGAFAAAAFHLVYYRDAVSPSAAVSAA